MREPQLPQIKYEPYKPTPPPLSENLKELLPTSTTNIVPTTVSEANMMEDELAAMMAAVSLERSTAPTPTDLLSYEVEPRMIVANNPQWIDKHMPGSKLSLRFYHGGQPLNPEKLLSQYRIMVTSRPVYTESLGSEENLYGSAETNGTPLVPQLDLTQEDISKNRLRVKLVPALTELGLYILNPDNNSYMSFLMLRFSIQVRVLPQPNSNVSYSIQSHKNTITLLFSVQPISFMPVNTVLKCGSLETATSFLRTHLVSYMDVPLFAPYLYAYKGSELIDNLLSGRDRFGAHFMHWLAAKGLPQSLRVLLLHYNLSPDQLDDLHGTPLAYALAAAQWRTSVQIIAHLYLSLSD